MITVPTTPISRLAERLVIEQASHALRKDRLFSLLGVISLDHAHTAERFRQAARDFRVDLAAFPEDGTNRAESLAQSQRETQQEAEGEDGHQGADPEQHDQRDAGG